MDEKAYYTILGAAIAGLTAAAIKILDIVRWSLEYKKKREDELTVRLYEIYMNSIYYCSAPPFSTPTDLLDRKSDAAIDRALAFWTNCLEFKSQRRKWLSLLAAYHPRPHTSESKDFQEKIFNESMDAKDIVALMVSDRRLTLTEPTFEHRPFIDMQQ